MAAAAIATSAISAYGSILQGQSTANSLNAQANLQLQNASEAEAQGQYDANKQSLIASQKIGQIKAGYGASGVTSNSGSALEVLAASTSNAELDRLNILHGADVKAINYENQASLDKMSASSAITASYFGAFGSLASGGINAAGKGISSAPPTISDGGYVNIGISNQNSAESLGSFGTKYTGPDESTMEAANA